MSLKNGKQKSKIIIPADETDKCVLCHALGFLGIICALVGWLINRKVSICIDECGKDSINFQISMTIYSITLACFGYLLGIMSSGFLVGLMQSLFAGDMPEILGEVINKIIPLLMAFIGIMSSITFGIVCRIIAINKAASGERYQYPITIKFLKW